MIADLLMWIVIVIVVTVAFFLWRANQRFAAFLDDDEHGYAPAQAADLKRASEQAEVLSEIRRADGSGDGE